MLSFNLRSTPSTMGAVSRQMSISSSMGRKSSRLIDDDDKYKLKVELQQRRRTATQRDLLESMHVVVGGSSPSPIISTEEANLGSSYDQQINKTAFIDANDQSELEDLIRKHKCSTLSPADGLTTVTDGRDNTLTPAGLGINGLTMDMNTTAQDISEEKDEDSTTSDSESLTGWTKFAHTVLPHVGLVLLTCTYTLIGASIFYSVEQPYEQQSKEKRLNSITEAKIEFFHEMWKLARQKGLTSDNFLSVGEERMQNLTDLLYKSFEEFHMTSSEVRDNRTQQIWTFQAAIFFAVTVVTTVGYGNPVPLTFIGRLVCIFFALIGVPLTLLTIADVGKFFSEHLIWLYGCYLELQLKVQKKIRRLRKIPSFEKLCDKCRDKHVIGSMDPDDYHHHHPHQRNVSSSLQMQHMVNDFENFDIQEKTVPATLLLFILISYTALGGLLLCTVETWTFFESFYFSFITMTTIGFGDLVPTKNAHIFLILLYIILGLVITTMCIDLVGVHYVQKIHYVGRKIQDARSALAIVGGKVVYIGDLYAQLLAKRYGIPKDQIGLMSDAFIIENLYSTKHIIPFVPRDITRIRYIDEGSESLSTSTGSYDMSCKYCHSRMTMSVSHYSQNSPSKIHQRLV